MIFMKDCLYPYLIEIIVILMIGSDPTPDGVALLDGIPKFLPYSAADKNYMKIHETWSVKKDFAKTYTITVDELKQQQSKMHNHHLH